MHPDLIQKSTNFPIQNKTCIIVYICLLQEPRKNRPLDRDTRVNFVIACRQAPPLLRRPVRIGMDGRGREVLGAEDGEAP